MTKNLFREKSIKNIAGGKMITIKSIKAWINREQRRLNQRTLSPQTIQEEASLQGSLMTIKKIKYYIEGKK